MTKTLGTRYIVGREPDGFTSLIVGPLRPLLASKGWTQAHRDAHKAANRRDIRGMKSNGLTVTVEREYAR